MDLNTYTYNNWIWGPQDTSSADRDNFFHAVFGEGEPCVDKNARFRRNCLVNFLTYFDVEQKPNPLKNWLENMLGLTEWQYSVYIKNLPHTESTISLKEIPFITALENITVVVFTGDGSEPQIFVPDEDFLGNYPWKTKNRPIEAVVHFNGETYTRLKGIEKSSNMSMLKGPIPSSKETYSKLRSAASLQGILYQINLLTIFLLNGTDAIKTWFLSTENEDAGKFDDLVFEIDSNYTILLQAKYRQTRGITYEELLSTNPDKSDFSLPKYYLSYQTLKKNFDVGKLLLCTNADLPKKCPYKHADIVQDGINICYTIDNAIIPELKIKAKEYREKNLENVKFDENVFDDDEFETFLSLFQLVARYPSKTDLSSIIEDILFQKKYCSKFDTRDCSKFLNDKMSEWYDNKKGRYLTQDTLKIFLSEFRSNKFCERLRNFQIHVNDDGIDYTDTKRLLHIESKVSYILSMIKIYSGLYAKNDKFLFLSPVEDFKKQMEMIRSFKAKEYVTLVACFNNIDPTCISKISLELTYILRAYQYKRIILVTGEDDSLSKSLKEENEELYHHTFENYRITDLNPDSQQTLLNTVLQLYHTLI